MSVDNLKRFGAMAEKDPELKEKLLAAGTDLEAIINLGKENGCEFTEEDFHEIYHTEMKDELSEEQLAGVAGGWFFPEAASAVTKAATAVADAATAVGHQLDVVTSGKVTPSLAHAVEHTSMSQRVINAVVDAAAG